MPKVTHAAPHSHAGKTVKIKSGQHAGSDYRVEDYWDRVSGESWMFAEGNPACIQYALRTGLHDKVPTDDEVVYGKIGSIGHLLHVSELDLS